MSLFDTPNADAYTVSIDEAAKGPRLGFQDAFMASWDVQTKVNSLYGLEVAFRDVEQRQRKRLRDAGLEPPESIGGADDAPYINTRRYLEAARSIVDGDGQFNDELVLYADERLKKMQTEHPELGIKTYAEMFKDVQDQAREALRRDSLSTTTMGAVGGFIGGAAASLNPETDPLNFLTLPAGGGSTILRRIAVQGAAQMGVEGLNIGLAPDTPRLVTGRDQTTGEIAARIGLAGVGGAGAQGFMEGGAALARRMITGKWFNDLPVDALPTREPAPPRPEPVQLGERLPPDRPFVDYPDFEAFARSQGYNLENPYGPSRQAALRHADDVAYVSQQLDRWDGPQAHAVAARTDTALPVDVEPGVRYDGAYQRYIDRLETTDDIARRLDPDVFRVYDKLEADRAELRARIETEAARFREFQGSETFFEREAEAHQMRDQQARLELQEIDAKMRDLAPVVSRAMAAAEKEWRSTPVDFNTLRFLQQLEQRTGWRYRGDDKPSLTEEPMRVKAAPDPLPVTTVSDAVPVSVLTPEQAAKLRPGHDAADRVAIATGDAMEQVHERVEKFIAGTRKVATMDAKELPAAQLAAREKIAKAMSAREAAMAAREESPAFQKWFEGSKVVDDDGAPLRVYHGTVATFDEFDMARLGEATGAPSAREALFFAKDPEVANSYAIPYDAYADADGLIGAYVRLLDKISFGYYQKFNEKILTLFGGGGLNTMGAPNVRPAYVQMRNPKIVDQAGKEFREETYFDVIRQAKAEGHDGVIFKNTFDPGFKGGEVKTDVYAVFSENQTRAFSERYDVTREEAARADAAIREAQREFADLHSVELPDGTRLDFNATMKDADGNDVTVREFLAEMDANSQALQAVRTCSAPS